MKSIAQATILFPQMLISDGVLSQFKPAYSRISFVPPGGSSATGRAV
jgi:hypothetical protein